MASTDAPTSFNFTPSQKVAVDRIKLFIKEPVSSNFRDRVLVLRGQAGTGKTTILKYALLELLQEDLKNDVYDEDDFFADTFRNIPNVMGVTVSHKAKLRLQESIPNAITYAGYFGLKPIYGFDGTLSFEKQKSVMGVKSYPHDVPYRVVVHDEVSMYDMNMVNYLEEYTNSYSKIILVGDPNQLPPIVSDPNKTTDMDSPVFIYFDNVVTLEERVRQTVGNPIMDLSHLIHTEIFGDNNLNRVMKAIKEENIKDGVGYRNIKRTSLISDYISHYTENDSTRVICYRNKTIDAINRTIRKKMFPNAERSFVERDAIYMNNTYRNKGDMLFYNSDEFVIKEIKEEVFVNIHCYKALVKDELLGSIMLVSEKGINDYKATEKRLKDKAITADFKKKSKAWKEYYDFKDLFADVSYGYAFTAYKAQGSGFRNVYIDVHDIMTTPISDKRKLQTLYTAVTRATHQVIFF